MEASPRPADPPLRLRLRQYVHRSWTEADGLPYAGVAAIAQTRDGYLWAGTRGGLARFDGARFVTFDTRNTPALQSSTVSALYAAPDGALWIGTLGGLVRYREGRFRAFTTADGLPSDNVWAVGGAPDGTLWIGTLGGLARYRKGRFKTFTTADGLGTNDVRAVSVAADGAVWVGTYGGGVSRLAGGRITSVSLAATPAGALVHAVLAGRGSVWVGVGEGQADRSPHQLLRLDDRAGAVAGPVTLDVNLSAVRALHEEPDGALWVGTYGGGLARYAEGVLEPFTAQEGLSDDRVDTFFEDRTGGLWVGTKGGLDLFRRDAPFRTYAAADGLPSDNVRAVTQDARGAVWVATATGAARIVAGKVSAFTDREGLAEPFIHSLWARPGGEVWLGGQHSVTRYADGRFTRFGLPASWPQGAIWSIADDRDGQLWLGSAGGGLIRFDPAGSRAYTVADGLAHNSVTALLPARAGGLWVGTASGLNRFVGGRVVRFGGAERFASINVRSLYEDAAGTLWVGTYGRGLMRLRSGRVDVFTVREGLHDDGVWSVLEDARGALWMSSDRGVFRVPKADFEAVAAGRRRLLRSVAYGVDDGMATAECNGAGKPAGWRARDGRMWFATQRGVVVVDPATADGPRPAPVVENVQVGEQTVGADAGGTVALARYGPRLHRRLHEPPLCGRRAASVPLPPRRVHGWLGRGRAPPRGRLHERPGGPLRLPRRRRQRRGNVERGRAAARGDSRAVRVGDGVVSAPRARGRGGRRLACGSGAGAPAAPARARARGPRRRPHRRAAPGQGDHRGAGRPPARDGRAQEPLLRQRLPRVPDAAHAHARPARRRPRRRVRAAPGPGCRPARPRAALRRPRAGAHRPDPRPLAPRGRPHAAARAPDRPRRLRRGAGGRLRAARRAPTHRADASVPDAPVEVWADPEHVGTVLANLLSNALKFTPEGGAVRVARRGGRARGARRVRDTGPGIPPADLPHVFDRFYQVAARRRAGRSGRASGSRSPGPRAPPRRDALG